jgi:hypothetical protein
MPERNKMEELNEEFDHFRDLPFPCGSTDDDLDALHAELTEYDGFIAGLIMTLLACGRVSTELLTFDHELKSRIEHVSDERPKLADLANEYLDYLEAINRLIAVGKACVE